MRRLELHYVNFPEEMRAATKFHQLEHLGISLWYVGSLKIDDVKNIIRLNPQLQSLKISGNSTMEMLDFISKQLKKLKTLEIDHKYEPIYTAIPVSFECVELLIVHVLGHYKKQKQGKYLSFKQLKECTITDFSDESGTNFVIENPTIEKLCINKRFRSSVFGEKNIEKIIAKLPNLTELNLIGYSCSMDAAIRFLDKSKTLRTFKCGKPDSKVKPDWNATRIDGLTVIEKK